MAKLSFTVVGSSIENTKVFGNADSAVEYCRARLHENFTIYIQADSETQKIIEQARFKLYTNLTNVTIQ